MKENNIYDNFDARVVLVTLENYIYSQDNLDGYNQSALKRQCREAIQTIWYKKRIKCKKKINRQLPSSVLWSENARNIVFANELLTGRFVLEHTYPLSLFVDKICDYIRDGTIKNTNDLIDILNNHQEGHVAVITKAEDQDISKNKLSKSLPLNGKAFDRYKNIKGEFMSLEEDSRFDSYYKI